MEHWKWMLGIIILLCCSELSVCSSAWKGEGGGRAKKIPFFNRHFECIISLFHKGQRVNSTLEHKGHHVENVTAQFVAFGRQFVVDLQLNKQLFSGSYLEKVFHSYGQSAETNHISRSHENCYYHGRLRFQPESEAALSTCDGLKGYITDKQDTYHIDHIGGDIHRIYRNRDQRQLPFRCGTESHDPRLHSHQTIISRHKRNIRAPYDSNTNTRYVELYLVNDYRTYERHGKNADIIIQRSQDIANIVSSLYRQLNIYVSLVGVEVWGGGDLVSISTSADNTMENFLRYRKERINPFHHNDNAQLITGVFFDHGVVGKAIKGPICTHQFSGGVNMDYGGLVTLVATTVAHEMGHNFGMEHDNDTMCECRDDKCIMAATSGQISPRRWSSCSQNALAEAFDLGMDYCLKNVPTFIYNGPTCGNGFKEEGEECDCGLPQDCTNRCCNATTCRLYPLAKCATGRCCDLEECKPKAASTLCREPISECDLSEYCNGTSEYCPDDVYLQNGLQCKGGQSYCYNGQCNTHTDQCKLLWGETGRVSDPVCFQQLNMNGNNDGNCGYNWTTDRYKRCDKENVMCGLLHCVHLNEKLMFWRDNLAIDMRASFLSRGNKQYVCRSAMLDVGLDMPDPGFVPDGAMCEQDKICINQQCVAITKLKVKECPKNCYDHGHCNSKGNCHCNIGYAPPLCDRPGYGGSIDSGPATDEYAKKDLLIALLVVFLLVIPIIVLAIIAFLNRKRLLQWWKLMPSFKYRVRGKSQKPAPPSLPASSAGHGFTEPPSARQNLISNPMMQHSTHNPETHAKPKVWNSSSSGVAVAPPDRPAAPRRPPSIVKSGAGSESKGSSKKVRLSVPIQETGGPPSPSSKQKLSGQFVTSMSGKQDLAKNIPDSPKANPVVKRESFRGSEISEPILVCTTNRNSLVLADGKVDIIGPEARLVSQSPPMKRPQVIQIKRSQSERPVSKPDPIRPKGVPPPPGGGTPKKSASARSPTRTIPSPTPAESSPGNPKNNPSGFRSRPVPPIPTHEEEDVQPVYMNESSDMSDLLSAIEGALKDSSSIYTNLSPPVQESTPHAPPRPSTAGRPKLGQTNSAGSPLASKPSGSVTENTASKPAPLALESKNKATPSFINNSEQKQTSVSKHKNSNPVSVIDKSPAAECDNKPTVLPPKPSLTSDNSKLKGAVSDELRNKILSRSGPKTTQQNSLSNPSSTSSAALLKPSKNSVSTASPGKPANTKANTKASGLEVHIPITKSTGPSSSTSTSSKVAAPNSEAGQTGTTKELSRPSRATSRVTSKSAPGAPNTASISRNANSTGSDKNTPRNASRDRALSPQPKTSSAISHVSHIAAKFDKSPEDPSSKPLIRKTSSLSPDDGSKKPVIATLTDSEKPALPGKPRVTSTKPGLSQKPVARVKSVAGTANKPSLLPKPEEQGAAVSTAPSSNPQPKKVQSYRI